MFSQIGAVFFMILELILSAVRLRLYFSVNETLVHISASLRDTEAELISGCSAFIFERFLFAHIKYPVVRLLLRLRLRVLATVY